MTSEDSDYHDDDVPSRAFRREKQEICFGCLWRTGKRKGRCTRTNLDRGCRECKLAGIVCLIGTIAYPPSEENVLIRMPSICDQCVAGGLSCSFNRPCDQCHQRGIVCSGSMQGSIWRGLPSTDMYGFYLNQWNGPLGIHDLNFPMFKWNQPDDYHLQFIRYIQTGQQDPTQAYARIYGNQGHPGRPVPALAPAPPAPPGQIHPNEPLPRLPPLGFVQASVVQVPPRAAGPEEPAEGPPARVGAAIRRALRRAGLPVPSAQAARAALLGPGVQAALPAPGMQAALPAPGVQAGPAAQNADEENTESAEQVVEATQAEGAQNQAPVTWEQIQAIYNGLLISATNARSEQGVSIDVEALFQTLNEDFQSGVRPAESQLVRDLLFYLDRQMSVYSRTNNPHRDEVNFALEGVRPGTDKALRLTTFNPGFYTNTVAPIRNVAQNPVHRPRSPGPSRPAYWIPYNTTDNQIDTENIRGIPPGHPQRVDYTALQRPFRDHPFEDARSLLTSIPHMREFPEGEMYRYHPELCRIESHGMVACGRQTVHGCEDRTHTGRGFPICTPCEQENRNLAIVHMTDLSEPMRAYFCTECTHKNVDVLKTLVGSGAQVYYHKEFPHSFEPNYGAPSITGTGLVGLTGGYGGPPLEITGCVCAVKLIGRRICPPHRLHYMQEIQKRCDEARAYVKSVWGRQVCPACKKNPPVNTPGLNLEQEMQRQIVNWQCLNCSGFVFSTRGAKLPPNRLSNIQNYGNVEAPYEPRPQDSEIFLRRVGMQDNHLWDIHMPTPDNVDGPSVEESVRTTLANATYQQ
ncbi:hypothetical protein M426DRAFT_257245 [Hypoxylon sp. CI-4A]|nr:hypothetical protein M426DRAFT_257245 [Hypoxylon sp. CI-4A]